jgi:hypothetical protein
LPASDVGAPAGAGGKSVVVSPQARLSPMRTQRATMALKNGLCIGSSVKRIYRILASK